jgi:hypothetical protein|tara:strand:+ start:8090 stop:8722 length:633 start_codon:yes stop_codon:yes gene_type:complete
MPPKRRATGEMPTSAKRQKREHPAVEHWLRLSNIAQSVAASTRQQQQYIALLLQISELTQHDVNAPANPWTGEQIDFEDVRNYVLGWLDDFDENSTAATKIRDTTLQSLRNADTQNDEELKSAAVLLTEAEYNIKNLENFTKRWQRIVRYKPDKKVSLREHTDTWLKRWLHQWETTNASKSTLAKQFRETLIFVSRDSTSPVLVQNRTES